MIRTEALPIPLPSIRLDRSVLLWMGFVGLGAILRFRDLGVRPLDPDEARVALEAFRGVGFGRAWASPESATPGYTGLMSLIFYVLGSSDAAARLVSALAGVCTLALSALAKPLVGTSGVLGVAALLAISPMMIESSRSALGASMLVATLFALVLILARVFQSLETSQLVSSRWFLAMGAAATAGLATDPLFTLNVLALVAALVFAFDLSDLRSRLNGVRSIPRWPILLGVVLTATIYTTRGLTNPGGLQFGFIDPLWVWTTELLQPARIPLVPLLMVLGTECLIVVTALGGALRLSRASSLERFAAAWLAITLAIAIIGGRSDLRLLAPVMLPAALLGGPWLARIVQGDRWREPITYVVGGIAAVPLLAALVASLPALSKSSAPELQLFYAGLAGFAGTVIGGLALVGRRTLTNGLIFMTLAVASIATFIGATRLSAAGGSDLGRAGPGAVFTVDLRAVEHQLAIWEWDQDRRPILVDDRLQGALGWALRSNRNVRWTGADEIRMGPAVKLASTRGDILPEGGLRVTIGHRFTQITELSPLRVAEWLLWRRSIPRVEPYDILLYR